MNRMTADEAAKISMQASYIDSALETIKASAESGKRSIKLTITSYDVQELEKLGYQIENKISINGLVVCKINW